MCETCEDLHAFMHVLYVSQVELTRYLLGCKMFQDKVAEKMRYILCLLQSASSLTVFGIIKKELNATELFCYVYISELVYSIMNNGLLNM
jgi:hypothetical protein